VARPPAAGPSGAPDVVLILAFVFALPAAATAHHRPPQWMPVPTGSEQQYRGLHAISARVASVGGSAGEVLRTTDGGATWQDVSPPGSAGLLFRDVEAQGADRASVLSIGTGDASRIYTTTDGGRSWTAFDTASYGAVDCVPGTCWASGPAGAVAVLAR
jgi:photosystem II stability/assembly factor-like uncharacterized protein